MSWRGGGRRVPRPLALAAFCGLVACRPSATFLAEGQTPQESALAVYPASTSKVFARTHFVYQAPCELRRPSPSSPPSCVGSTVVAGPALRRWRPPSAANASRQDSPGHAPVKPTQPHRRGPTVAAPLREPKGVALLLHACNHDPSHFWELPEEAAITLAVLRKGLVAVAPFSTPNLWPNHRCWHPKVDGPLLLSSLPLLLQELGLQSKPVYGVGVSSGGVMLAALVAASPGSFAGAQFVVSSPGVENGRGPGISGPSGEGGPNIFSAARFPPTSFVIMPNDLNAYPKSSVELAVKFLHHGRTPVQVLEALPKPVGWLLGRAPQMGLSRDEVQELIKLIDRVRLLDSRPCGSGAAPGVALAPHATPPPLPANERCLRPDVGEGFFAVLVASAPPPLKQRIEANALDVSEELRVALGKHSPTAEHFEESLDFILQSGTTR